MKAVKVERRRLNSELKNIFEAQPWYRGRYENMDAIKLTSKEKRFIEEIKKRE